MSTKFWAEFTLKGVNVLPDKITSFLGITPSQTWLIGDNLFGKIQSKCNGWLLQTDKEIVSDDDQWEVEKHIERLLTQLKPHIPKIKEFSTRYKLEITICGVIYTEDANPQVFLKQAILRQITDLGANLYFDFYTFV